MTKKITLFSLILTIIFVSLSTAFAVEKKTVFSDISDATIKAAAERLANLGIVEDDGNGKYNPDAKVTRAQMAKMIVISKGLGDAAKISAGSTKFKDVKADYWASGYINIAVGADIISGYPDGTFAPDNEVNYAEGITMIVRALGYGPVMAGKPWPSWTITQALHLDLLKGVIMSPTTGMSRGNFAIIMNAALDAPMVYVKAYSKDNTPEYASDDPSQTLFNRTFNHN